MMNLNAIQFAAGLSVDFSGEIDDLETLVNEAEKDMSKIDEAVRTYRHLSSFLQGIDYILDYFEEDEARQQLKELSDKNWHTDLQRFWAPIMELKGSRELDEPVKVMEVCYPDHSKSYDVTVGGETHHFQSNESAARFLRERRA